MNSNSESFKKILGDRAYTVAMMNMILKGEKEPLMEGAANPDWTAIESNVKSYGAPGEEILLRAKTVHFLNHQDWANYLPVAEVYLEKYGKNIQEEERKLFEENIKAHK